jgi:2-haloacid dehalogenase
MTDHSSVVVFDAYGTLLDFGSAVARHAGAIGPDATRLTELWRAKQLEYTWVLSLLGSYEPFWELTARALDFALASLPSVDPVFRQPLLDAYRSLDAYPEVGAVLSELRDRGLRTAVLSNGDPTMLNDAFAGAGLIPLLDRILSADQVRMFKTAPPVYALVTDAFGVSPEQVAFASSNRWDVAGAVAFGFRAVWVHRGGAPDEYPDHRPAAIVGDLRGLLPLV